MHTGYPRVNSMSMLDGIFPSVFFGTVERGTPQPLYNTIVGVQVYFRVSYPIRVIRRVKCIDT